MPFDISKRSGVVAWITNVTDRQTDRTVDSNSTV